MSIPKVISLAILTPLAAMIVVGAVSACMTSSPDAHKDAAPSPSAGVGEAPSSATQANPAKRLLAECKALWDGMQQQVQRFDASHSACKGDADCATVADRACIMECETGVRKEAVKEREALWSKIDQNECKTFKDKGCWETMSIPVPSCAAVVPVCTDGKCGTKMRW